MTAQRYLLAQAYNNAWANHRLLKACGELSREELDATRVSFFPSIIHTLNHILTVDWLYISALEGNCLGPAAFEPEIPCPLFADLDREQRAADRRLIDHCRRLDEKTVAEEIRIPRNTFVQVEPADRLLMHLFQHQIHHRGQVHAMLSGTTVQPPQLDEFFCTGEDQLRQQDFAELGFTEAMIWS
ncbi:DinB family protein [Neorhizobium galegae bv. officinalis bv. officinalis str. HAMBI 1141]|uniref:DinB family protein n=1 Tax=Neorhizobium galegae bv. officinalis bv. officinalis str. HAMBI 1141 TaxID=1028801 RepID=A0A068T666_NEOGA|nr:DinB family protein [Neorhizobium galegae]CDN53963.1 DinB family protein [Neorhizobium galegae bv. officinalis bv. officinalis str. HAMBI 1141]